MGLASRLITRIGSVDITSSRHLPNPGPRAPAKSAPSPDSNAAAVYVRAAPVGSDMVTSPSDEAPSSSVPRTVTETDSDPGLTSLSMPTWLGLLPGLNVTRRYASPRRGAVSLIAVRNPFLLA